MRIHTSDKVIAYLALLSGLTISAVAIYYSVAGLVAIFAAAVIPIIVMGVALELSKLVATVWLKLNWSRSPFFIKTYLIIAIAFLMAITSMGIFGFLSKAHSDQSLVSGDVTSKIAIYDEKIKTAKDNIDANRRALKQMDEAVDQVMGRSSDEKGADKAVALRRGQAKERARLLSEITAEQKVIAQLSEERAPIAAEVRKVEAEVGPIKYIAALIYGDNPDANLLERAVRWVIIVIVIVFDPLAVILLLASQYSFQWFREEKEKLEDTIDKIEETLSTAEEPEPNDTGYEHGPWPFPVQEKIVSTDNNPKEKVFVEPIETWEFPKHANIQDYQTEEEDDIPEDVPSTEKKAMKAWKQDNPSGSLKQQRSLFERGIIDRLPWEEYLKPEPDFVDEAAKEAKKWAEENPQTEEAEEAKEWAEERLDERPGDYITENQITWMEHDENGNQIKKTKDNYQQNAEQNERTLWQRIQDAKK